MFEFIWLFNTLCFTSITLFASLGMSMVVNNYPDTLLSAPQKRYFNFQYIFNLLLISFIIAHIYSQRWLLGLIGLDFNLSFFQTVWIYLPLIVFVLMLFFQLRILYGMFRLRRELYANYLKLLDELANETVSQ
jgi:signal transduction histidine kinase